MKTKAVRFIAITVLLFTLVSVFASCGSRGNEGGLMEIPNPIKQVDGIYDLFDETGARFPVLSGKEAEVYQVVKANGKVYRGEIRYTDGSALFIGEGNGDISGIYGAVEVKTEPISAVEVVFWEYNGFYATWNFNGYSYCYIGSKDETLGQLSYNVWNIVND